MREIKFRAYYKNGMMEVANLDMRGPKETWLCDLASHGDELFGIYMDEVELMQYTGLKDRNGVEIYEGDILKITNTKRFCGKNYTCYSEVKIIDGHVYVWPHPIVDGEIKRFGAKLLFSGMAKYIKDKGVATDDVKVVGNIHENKELLKEN